jgi:predicted HTH domain antitoxin
LCVNAFNKELVGQAKQKLIMIMFCEFDLFKKGKPIYEIIRYVKDTKVIANDGIREIYINLKAKVTDKKLKSLFKIMITVDNTDDKEFPKLSLTKDRVNKLYIGGENNMAGLDLMMYNNGVKAGKKEGIMEGRAEGSKNSIVSLYKKGLITIEVAAEELNMSTEEFKKSID